MTFLIKLLYGYYVSKVWIKIPYHGDLCQQLVRAQEQEIAQICTFR